jgi:hypothetical protein
MEFRLVFQHWCCQVGALFKPFKCKVLIAESNLPAHVWSEEVVQAILGSSYFGFDSAPSSREGVDMDSFLVATWASDPDLIPTEVGFSILEPLEPLEIGVRPLFL